MKEQGVVTKVIAANLAEVALRKSEACAKCGACREISSDMVAIEAVNEPGAKRGDIVEIEISDTEIIKASFVVYLLPVFFLAGGYLLGSALFRWFGAAERQEAGGMILGFFALGLSFIAVQWYDKKSRREAARARIRKIISTQ